jgi:hypothetical protein
MPKNMTIQGFGPKREEAYWIELPMVEEHRVNELINTCRQHARFQGATRVIIEIDE